MSQGHPRNPIPAARNRPARTRTLGRHTEFVTSPRIGPPLIATSLIYEPLPPRLSAMIEGFWGLSERIPGVRGRAPPRTEVPEIGKFLHTYSHLQMSAEPEYGCERKRGGEELGTW